MVADFARLGRLLGGRQWVAERETVEFEDVECIAETPVAIRVDIDGEKYWIPQSQVHDDSEVWRLGQKGKLVITRWIAEQKNLV